MQRVPQVLQLSVIIERIRAFSLESQPSQKFNFITGNIAAELSVLKELGESRLDLEAGVQFFLNEYKLLRLPGDKSIVQRNFHIECRGIDVPVCNQRAQE